jgi:hypothetical protein
VQFDIPAFGWSSTKEHVGLWCINPTIEYLSGGATKVELTGHLDNNVGGAPTLLNYWRGSHYGGSRCDIAEGESWNKVVGPFLIYCNAGPTPDAMWKDALSQAENEAAQWPYEWVNGVEYPHKAERGVVSGQIVLSDPQVPAEHMSHLLVGLAWPDTTVTRNSRRDGGGTVDWQQDAKHYEFWARGDDAGRFIIPNVRGGIYTLHAIADGVLGEFSVARVAVTPGQSLDLGKLEWKPVRFGRQLWAWRSLLAVGFIQPIRQGISQRRQLHHRQERLAHRLELRAASARGKADDVDDSIFAVGSAYRTSDSSHRFRRQQRQEFGSWSQQSTGRQGRATSRHGHDSPRWNSRILVRARRDV